MAAARAAHAPPFTIRGDPSLHDIPPAVSRDSPPPRAAQWRPAPAPRRPVARWLGIGSCALLIGLLATTTLTPPISAEIQRLIRPWLEWQRERETAAPHAGPTLATTPAPAVSGVEPASGSMPMLARDGFGSAGPPGASALAAGAAVGAPDDPPAASVPVPSFKPPAPDR